MRENVSTARHEEPREFPMTLLPLEGDPERDICTFAVAEPEPGRHDEDEMFQPFE